MEAAPARMEPAPESWSLARRFGFRFAVLYGMLYCLPFPLTHLPYTGWITGPLDSLQTAFMLWCGSHVLGIEREIPTAPTGSGDGTLAYVFLAVDVALALAGALVWSALAKRCTDHRRLEPWASAYVRMFLGVYMITYGAYKVIPSQFPAPALDRLAQPFGEASPMGLLWTFMGASTAYQIFTGAGELLGGLLLFHRRTSAAGALVSIAVLAQVVALNFCFDTPVKLLSGHLLLMAVFLLLPEASKLFGLFVRGRNAAPLALRRLFASPRWHNVGRGLRTAFLGSCLYQTLSVSHEARSAYAVPPPTPFDGVWRVAEFVDDAPEPFAEDARWTELVVANALRLGVTNAGGRYGRLQVQLDEPTSSLKLTRRGDPAFTAEFTYELAAPDALRWNGTLEGHPVHLSFVRRPDREYLLVERGFHWINEVPFNR